MKITFTGSFTLEINVSKEEEERIVKSIHDGHDIMTYEGDTNYFIVASKVCLITINK